ncbi:MAG: acyl-CoA dehydrogenase family protein [Acidimicrobiia bacterium]
MRAEPVADGWVLRGTKTWSTFAGRAELLAVLARTDPDPGSGHRGLSMFVVDKPRCPGREFVLDQPGGGVLRGRAIPTIGYRGMHSFELVFDGWRVAGNALVGEEAGRDRGFYLQLLGFGTGRLQTAARAVGTMQAAYDAAADYAATRETFGAPLITRPLMRRLLADMAVRIAVNRVFSYSVAPQMGHPRGHLEASMVKALSCRAAESVTRDAMQVFGGYGYAEEYSVSRYFVDARVLSIFEGAEEVLALRVIAGNLVADAAGR